MFGKIKALTAGFVVGLLIAPRAGRESRRLIGEWLNEFFGGGPRRLQSLQDELDKDLDGDWGAESLAEGESLP